MVLEGGEGYVEAAGEVGGAAGGGDGDDAEAGGYASGEVVEGEFGGGAGAEAEEEAILDVANGMKGGGIL